MVEREKISGQSGGTGKPFVNTVPPHDLDAEQCVLGAMMTNPSAIPVALDKLTAGDFFRDSNRDIFHAITKMWNADSDSVDAITVSSKVPQYKEAIHAMVEMLPVASNIRQYVGIVKHMSLCRSLITAGQRIVQIGQRDGDDADSLLSEAESIVFSLRPKGDKDTKLAKEVAHTIVNEVENHVTPKVSKTGYDKIDAICGGLHASNLIIVGARPGIGKTAVAIAIAKNVAQTGTVLFFSLEMSQKELIERLICSIACVPVTKLRARDLDDIELDSVKQAMPEIERADLRIIDSPSMSMMGVKSKARQYATKTDISLIVIDYLQLLTLGYKTGSRYEEVTTISRELKSLSRELSVPIMALSQLNRASTFDGTKVDISQLRESGSLEQDADQVWLLSWPKAKEFDDFDSITVDVAKNRHGQMGKVDLLWNKRWCRIEL